jgi:hypothetical protein
MKKLILLACICFSLAIVSCKETAKETDASAETEMSQENAVNKADMAMAAEYQCPMDCEEGKTYDKEGTCPVCKMDLKKKESEENQSHDEGAHEDHDESHN